MNKVLSVSESSVKLMEYVITDPTVVNGVDFLSSLLSVQDNTQPSLIQFELHNYRIGSPFKTASSHHLISTSESSSSVIY